MTSPQSIIHVKRVTFALLGIRNIYDSSTDHWWWHWQFTYIYVRGSNSSCIGIASETTILRRYGHTYNAYGSMYINFLISLIFLVYCNVTYGKLWSSVIIYLNVKNVLDREKFTFAEVPPFSMRSSIFYEFETPMKMASVGLYGFDFILFWKCFCSKERCFII